jgi:hypothetical protein
MKTCSFSAIIRSSGIYDIVIMIPFAIPGLVAWTMHQISNVHDSLMLAGTVPEFSSMHLLFINIMAIVTIVWSVLRVIDPIPLYGIFDTVSRIFIAAIMLVYLLQYNISGILWIFFMVEITWAIIQINAYFFKYKPSLVLSEQSA